MEGVIDSTLSIEEKKSLAKKCIDRGYSVEWHYNNDMIRVYIASELNNSKRTAEISADILVGRGSTIEGLGRIKHLVISVNSFNPKWKPLFSYPSSIELDELDSTPNARRLYDHIREIFI